MTAQPRQVTRTEVTAIERLFGVAGIGEEYVRNGIWEILDESAREQSPNGA